MLELKSHQLRQGANLQEKEHEEKMAKINKRLEDILVTVKARNENATDIDILDQLLDQVKLTQMNNFM
ncbi:hypothetical protein KC887_04640 [Candidatus Kaiserbacteria bacterium]|nr:hypothetical protein [Candidatus Kaiserbacteria bacterium]